MASAYTITKRCPAIVRKLSVKERLVFRLLPNAAGLAANAADEVFEWLRGHGIKIDNASWNNYAEAANGEDLGRTLHFEATPKALQKFEREDAVNFHRSTGFIQWTLTITKPKEAGNVA